MKHIRFVCLTLVIVGILSGCSTGNGARKDDVLKPVSDEEGPKTFFKRFRTSLKKGEWKYVHLLLSKRARNCYSRSMLERFLTRTKPGILERSRLLYWDIERVEAGSGPEKARILLVHPRVPEEYRKWYPYKLENDIWRLDWSLADIFQVPRSVENSK